MNTEFQQEFMKTTESTSLRDSFNKAVYFKSSKYDSVYNGLLDFVGNNDSRIIILSKWCRNVKGLKIKAVYKAIANLKIQEYVHPFFDEDYLKPHGAYRDVLIKINELSKISKFFDLTPKEFKKSAYSWDVGFSLSDYRKFIVKRRMIEAKRAEIDESYLSDIQLDSRFYYTKEYVSSRKYSSDYLKSYVESNIKNITEGEKAAKNILDKNGLVYEFQKACIINGHSYIMDFYLPEYGVCIEIDGGYHDTQEQLLKDRERTNLISKSGILLVRFTNDEAIEEIGIQLFITNVLKK